MVKWSTVKTICHFFNATLTFRSLVLWLSACCQLLSACSITELSLPKASWVKLVILLALINGLFVIAASIFWRIDRLSFRSLLVWGAIAVISRIIVWNAPHFLSDDAYRYHWDGKVFAAGINPYRYAPADDQLFPLHIEPLDDRINHPTLRTAYPPLSQIIFRIGYQLTPDSLRGLQATLLVLEIIGWLLSARLLRNVGQPNAYLLLMMGLPLAWIEGYLPAHIDIALLPVVAGFLLALGKAGPKPSNRIVRAGVTGPYQRDTAPSPAAGEGWDERGPTPLRIIAIGLTLSAAILIKPYFLILLPATLSRFRCKSFVALVVLSIGIVFAAYLPFLDARMGVIESTVRMAKQWEFNGPIYSLLTIVLTGDQARLVSLIVLVTILIVGSTVPAAMTKWTGADFLPPLNDLSGRLQLALLGFLLCAPTVYPWYLIGFLPLLIINPTPALCWIFLTIVCVESVWLEQLQTGGWRLPSWVLLIEYLPLLFLLRHRSTTQSGTVISAPTTP